MRPSNRLQPDELEIWDEIAPLLAMSQRLKPLYKYPLILLCKAIASEHRLTSFLNYTEIGETYESSTRNGYQIKMRPEVGQLNEIRRVIRTYVGDFGLSPSAEKQLMNAMQLDLFDAEKNKNPFSQLDDAAGDYTLQ
jgi:phage terminase small subunit